VNAVSRIQRFVRWSDWGAGKIPVLCTVACYVGLVSNLVSSVRFLADLVLFVIFAAVHSALGYVANDWGDRELDAVHDKPNAFAYLTRVQGAVAFGAVLVLALLSGLPFVGRPAFLPLWLAWATFALAYSLRPVRLKERGAWGLCASFVAQWSLPVCLAFAVFGRFGEWDMAVMALAITTSGATLEIAHQRWDRIRDAGTRTRTFGARISATRLDWTFVAAILCDKAAVGSVVVTATLMLESVTLHGWMLRPGLPLLGLYAILVSLSLVEMGRAWRRGEILDPYYSTERSASKLLHETFSNLVLPVYLLSLATYAYPVNGFLLVIFAFWRVVLGHADWLWPLRMLWAWIKR